MSPSLLPPRGIFIPTRMIFNHELPAAVLVTWIQLRSLAWAGWDTPPLSIAELASLTGIHPARLNRHLSQLRDVSELSWRTSGKGKIIMTFPEEPTALSENFPESRYHSSSTLINSKEQELLDPPSYFPNRIQGYLSFQEDHEDSFCNDSPEQYLVVAEVNEARRCEGEKSQSNYYSEFNHAARLGNQSP